MVSLFIGSRASIEGRIGDQALIDDAMRRSKTKADEEKENEKIRLEARQRLSYELHQIEHGLERLEYLNEIPENQRTPQNNLDIENAEGSVNKAKRLIREDLLLDKSKGTVFRQEIKKGLEEYFGLTKAQRRARHASNTPRY